MEDPRIEPGTVDPVVAAEFPDLRIVWVDVQARAGRSPAGLRERLRDLSDGFRGSQAVMLRQQPIPHAYRVFFRQVGLDPDADRTPVEALALERLRAGEFKSRNTLDDALTIATMETGVPIWALDADKSAGRLRIRPAGRGEPLGRVQEEGRGARVPAGRLVVADDDGPLAPLFGDIAGGHGVTAETTRMRLFSVLAPGVPEIHVEEALWLTEEILLEGS